MLKLNEGINILSIHTETKVIIFTPIYRFNSYLVETQDLMLVELPKNYMIKLCCFI